MESNVKLDAEGVDGNVVENVDKLNKLEGKKDIAGVVKVFVNEETTTGIPVLGC